MHHFSNAFNITLTLDCCILRETEPRIKVLIVVYKMKNFMICFRFCLAVKNVCINQKFTNWLEFFWLQNDFIVHGWYRLVLKSHKRPRLSTRVNFKTTMVFLLKMQFCAICFKISFPVKIERFVVFLITASCRSHANWNLL